MNNLKLMRARCNLALTMIADKGIREPIEAYIERLESGEGLLDIFIQSLSKVTEDLRKENEKNLKKLRFEDDDDNAR